MRILIIDNYDSYTFNIYALVHTQQQQQLLEASSESPPESCEIVVIRNNQVSSAFLLNHILPHFEAVILSPGPGTPHEKEVFRERERERQGECFWKYKH